MSMIDSQQAALDVAAVSAGDPGRQIDSVLGLPDQLRDAVWKAESADLGTWDSPPGLIVAGMGGSGIGGRLARAIIADQASRPIVSAGTYGLPPWTTADSTVLCSSYSGETEETLACFEAAGVIGARRVVATTGGRLAEQARAEGVPVIPIAGGLQPRFAVAYLTIAALEVAAACGAGPRLRPELDVAAERLEELVAAWGPQAAEDNEAKQLARALCGTVPIVMGAGLTAPIAYRWKTQINENAKQPSFSSELPEADHNEIVGWCTAERYARFSAVFLGDADATPRIVERIALTRELLESRAAGTHLLTTRGQTSVERVFSLVLLGDLMSVYLAILGGQDPEEIAVLNELKSRLSQA